MPEPVIYRTYSVDGNAAELVYNVVWTKSRMIVFLEKVLAKIPAFDRLAKNNSAEIHIETHFC